MNDAKTDIKVLKDLVNAFVDERDWSQFHSGKNLAMAISVEAAELMELFMWIENSDSEQAYEENKPAINHELADVLITCLCFANRYDIDLSTIVKEKIELIKEKYPADKAKGKYQKYTHYQE